MDCRHLAPRFSNYVGLDSIGASEPIGKLSQHGTRGLIGRSRMNNEDYTRAIHLNSFSLMKSALTFYIRIRQILEVREANRVADVVIGASFIFVT